MDNNIFNTNNSNVTILLIIVLVLMCLLNYINKNKDVTSVRSTVDNRIYMVAKLPDSIDAANKLAEINNNILKLVDFCKGIDKTNFNRLKKLYKPSSLCELVDKSVYTAYNVNKGEEIAICIRDKNNKILDDMNSCMFIIIHELAHIMTISEQHTPEFWDNMRQLLEKAEGCNVYTPIDYSKNPTHYCNQTIRETPYKFK